MSKPASNAALRDLHRKLAQVMSEALDQHDEINAALKEQHEARVARAETDEDREMVGTFMPTPVPAALLNSISKFLKDNEITSSVDDDPEMEALRDKLREKQHAGRARPAAESPLDLSDLPIHGEA